MTAPARKTRRLLRHRGVGIAVISALIIFGMLFCYVRQVRFLRLLDHKIYDTLLHTRANGEITPYPVIIDLDEASIEAYGQWPWPRFLLAELLDRLRSEGVAAVGLDILLSEEDRTSPRKLREDLRRFLDLDVTFTGLPGTLADYDQVLADSLGKAMVLGMYCHFTPAPGSAAGAGEAGTAAPPAAAALDAAPAASPAAAAPPPVGSVVQRVAGAPPLEKLANRAGSASLPLPVFWQAAPVGMINMNPDEDGVVRRLPLIGLYNGNMYASLALRTLMAGLGVNTLATRLGPDGIESVRVGSFTIPLGPDGSFTIPFRGGAYSFPYYSAKDILNGAVPPDALRGKLAFIGTSAPGLLDIRITPLERVYPGVEVHATVLDAILSQHFLRTPAWTPGAQAIGIVLGGLVAALAFGFARPRVYIVVAALLIGGALYASYHLFGKGYVFSPLYVVLTITLLGAALLMLRFWQEERQKNVLRSAFSRYVAPEIVERITRLEGDVFAGEERELSIMFTDIRGFTSISEKLSPRQIVLLLNRYFTPMTALVRGNKGTLDKFIGDALMAFWNAPVQVPDHPRLAVETALNMHERLEELNSALREEFGVSIRMGVGVHTGKAYVGNMGSEELLNYTLIGDNVNLASRLEGLCPQFGVGIVVSAETRERCDNHIAFLPLDTLRVKGKQQPVSVYAAMRPDEWKRREAEQNEYLTAYAHYKEGAFAKAVALFSALVERFPECKLYALYAERCTLLRDNPPQDWDGVWTLKSK